MSQMVGWDRGADRASNDADVSSTLPIMPYGGVSPIRLGGWHVGQHLPTHPTAQACSRHTPTDVWFVSAFRARRNDRSNPALCRDGRATVRRHGGGVVLRPRGPRSCPSYAVSPAPPASTSRFHRIAAYTRCLRCAGAPRRPAGGSGLSLTIPSWHAALYDPGELDHNFDADMAFAEI